MYGDSAYPKFFSNLKSAIRHDGRTVMDRRKNKAFTKVRVGIEWNYKTTSNMFKILRNKEKLKILGSRNNSKLYTVCMILKKLPYCTVWMSKS